MIDSKDLEILEVLKKNSDRKFTKIKDFLNYIKISRGDFYYHLKHINSALKKENLTLDITNLSKSSFDKIYCLIVSKEDVFISNYVSGHILAAYVLLHDYAKLNTISKLLNISVNSAFKTINRINRIIREKYEYDKIFICNDGNGYYFRGDELSKRKLLVNLSIQINNNKSSKLILEFIFSKFKLSYTGEDFLKIKFILLSYSEEMLFIDLEWDTLSFILYVLIICRNKFIDGKKIYDEIKNKQFYLNQKSYTIASDIIDKICEEFNISFYSNEFEKLFLSCIISSKYDSIIIENFDQEYNEIIEYLDKMFLILEDQGYSIERFSAKKNLFRYLIWIKYKWCFFWVFDFATQLKSNFIKAKESYWRLYNFLLNYMQSIISLMNNRKLIDFQIVDITVILLSSIKSFPDTINFLNKNDEAIIVSDLKGNLIDLLKIKAIEMFPKFYIDKIISRSNYEKNKSNFSNYYKISNNISIKNDPGGIYFLLSTTFEDFLEKINVSPLSINDLLFPEKARQILMKVLKYDISKEEKVEVLLQLLYFLKNC